VALHGAATAKRAFLEQFGPDARFIGDRAGLEGRFERAVSSLWLAYQPIVRAGDGGVFAHEALARTSEDSFLNADALVEAAERLGRVQELGRAVRRQASGASADTLFVNLHAAELADAELYDPRSALARRAQDVVLEITERTALDRVADVPGRLARLRQLGYRIAVDDLGAGYAGLSSVTALAPEVVKLDMSLVRGCDREPVKRKLIASMASLCRDLGAPLVAEGVETEAERTAVTEEGCDLLQGFLLGAPAARAVA
jgi:EAL domain-containing protein (putative c-di-GMP-specific phosphodiesterase class I)